MPHSIGADIAFLRLLSFYRIAYLAHVKWGFSGKAVRSLRPVAFVGTASVPTYRARTDRKFNRIKASVAQVLDIYRPLTRAT